MIYTLTYDASIEKHVYGNRIDEINFDLIQTSYSLYGSGLKTSIYLKYYNMDSKAIALCSYKHASFIKEEMKKRNIPLLLVEKDSESSLRHVYINEEEEIFKKENINIEIDDAQMNILTTLCKSECKDKSTFIISYNDYKISKEAMKNHYEQVKEKADTIIVSLHPKYYEIIHQYKTNILVIDKKDLLEYMDVKELSLEKCKEVIINELSHLANMVVFASSSKELLVFTNDKIYHCICLYKDINSTVIKESIISAIIKGLQSEVDIYTYCRMCTLMSAASAFSEGLYMPKKDLVEKLESFIHVYEL